jgi:hypothetical protein
MPKIPLMDYVGRPLLACVFLALLLLQWRFPLRRQHFSVLHRLVRNFVLSIPGLAIVRFAMLPIPIAVAMWAKEEHIGLLNWLGVPLWIAGDRYVSADGLRLLVVALGAPHDSSLLAIS